MTTNWQYGLAHYTPGTFMIEAHAEYMNDMQGGAQHVPEFLRNAGSKGWELCTFLPGRDENDGCLLFKRPA